MRGSLRCPHWYCTLLVGLASNPLPLQKSSVGSAVIEPAVTELSSIFIPFALSQPWCEKTSKHICSSAKRGEKKKRTKPLVYNWFTAELIIHSDYRSLPRTTGGDRTRRTNTYTNSLKVLQKKWRADNESARRVFSLLKSSHLLKKPKKKSPGRTQCGGFTPQSNFKVFLSRLVRVFEADKRTDYQSFSAVEFKS